MIDLSDCDTLELKDRYESLVGEYVELSLSVAKVLEKFGRMRKELQLLVVELEKRGCLPEDNLDLENKIDQAMSEGEDEISHN